jgi:plasmid stabilization system protein ParE
MSRYKVFLSNTVEQDIRDPFNYIAKTLKVPITAMDHLEAIEIALADLEANPEVHPLVRDERLAALGYRWLPVKGYVIFYTIGEAKKSVDVVRVLYAKRNWASILISNP